MIRRSLRLKVILGIVLPLLVVLGAFTLIEYRRHRAVMLSNLSLLASHSSQVIESNVRQQMLQMDFEGLQQLLDSVGESEEFLAVYLMDNQGEVIFAPQNEGVGKQLNNANRDCQPCHRLPAEERPSSIVVNNADGVRVFRSMNPIENSTECSTCHNSEDRFAGLLLIDISTAPFASALQADLRENLIWWGITIFVVVLVVNLALNRLVLKRLESLAGAIGVLGEGQAPQHLADEVPDEIGELSTGFNRMANQIESRTAENENLSETLRRESEERGELLKRLITAQEDERFRVARELHDELGQALGSLSLQSKLTQQWMMNDFQKAEAQLDQMQSLIAQATDQMYGLILDLRPSVLDDLGLAAALRSHGDRCFDGNGVRFTLNAKRLPKRLPPEIETTLYRVFQEAMSNAARHSNARRVQVILTCNDGYFNGSIRDNGVGFDMGEIDIRAEEPRGLGLLGMRERVAQLRGEIEIRTGIDQGTYIRLRIPLEEKLND